MLRSVRVLLGLSFGVFCVSTACGGGERNSSPGPGAGAGGGTGGSGGLNVGTGGSLIPGGGNGGSGNPIGEDPILDPEPEPCAADGSCPDGFICTIADMCGKVGAACNENTDCTQGDTYCCKGPECRKDGLDEGVCLPGNVPPGLPCTGEVNIGVFAPQIQCEWTTNDEWGAYVAVTPLVANLPTDSGRAAEIVVVSYGCTDCSPADTNMGGTLRIIHGGTCELIETIHDSKGLVRANSTPALGDLDGDGDIDIVAYKKDGGLISFRWDGSKYVKWWETDGPPLSSTSQVWSGPAIHDLDGGAPEVIAAFGGFAEAQLIRTYNGLNGQQKGSDVPTSNAWNGIIAVVGDLDNDGTPDSLTNASNSIRSVTWTGSGWSSPTLIVDKPATHFAFADFGTPTGGGGFDHTQKDGIAEIVAVYDDSNSRVGIYTLSGQTVMEVSTSPDTRPGVPGTLSQESGGPPVIGDFDNDGMPEVAVAGASRLRVFDLDCKDGGDGCEDDYIRWSQPSQDFSSRQTGASLFDFDGDGQAEVVYADECFLRVYDGNTGTVLFSSYRTSATWYEGPVIADVENDQSTKIVVNSAHRVACGEEQGVEYPDPLHPGVRCDSADDCIPGGNCVAGLCRCSGNSDCDEGLTCQEPIDGSAASGNVCRATHPNANSPGGIRVLRDRLNRWASSRPLWNQHAYSVTNINDDGSIPTMSEWQQNFTRDDLNNYRQNIQGTAGVNDMADVTGRLNTADLCRVVDNRLVLTGRVCNRGNRTVGARLPATFYDESNNVLCVSHTEEAVEGAGDCKAVHCELDVRDLEGSVRMVVNDDGEGGRTTVECRYDNNNDVVKLEKRDCVIVR